MEKAGRMIWLILCLLCVSNSAHAEQHDRWYYEKNGDVVWEVKTKQKVVALTFDDGPDRLYTNQILDILKENNAKATFFVVGKRVKENPEVAQNIIINGNEIANHTFTHPNLNRINKSQLTKEIRDAEQTVLSTTGVRPSLFRPPLGHYNDEIISNVRENDYIVVMWSWHQDTYDWKNPGVKTIVNNVLSNICNGDIILFHDFGGDRSQTVQALEIIVPELKRKGYQFVTVSELLQEDAKFKFPLTEMN
ncbi:polysaccharide deacetylase family protein [Halalkalibacter oceani]|uniref:polysaccharide deacetylase family protein n=1 Tax=Halalkalibacter oceani TaxID=1653776 RepID=UPI0033919DAB